MFFEQLALSCDVTAVALGEDVLSHGADRLAGDDPAADRRLDRHVEHLAGDERLELVHEVAAVVDGVVAVGDKREGIDRLTVHEDVELHQRRGTVLAEGVVEAGVSLRARLQFVVKVDQNLGQRDAVFEQHAAFALLGAVVLDDAVLQVFRALVLAAVGRHEFHHRADVAVGADDADVHPGLADLLHLLRRGQFGRAVDEDVFAVRLRHLVLNAGRGGEQIEVVLALEAFLDDLHMEEAEEAAAEAKAKGGRRLGRVGKRGIGELQLVERVAEERVLVALLRIDAGEDHGLGGAVAGHGGVGGLAVVGEGIADAAVLHGLQPGGDVADLADGELVHLVEGRTEDADFQRLEGEVRRHEAQTALVVDMAVEDAAVGDDALVGVPLAVEDEGA